MTEKTPIPGVYKEAPGQFVNKDSESLKAYRLQKNLHRQVTLLGKEVKELRQMVEDLVTKYNKGME